MSTQKIVNALPAFYTEFLPDFFKQSIPQESFATCHRCAMAHHKPETTAQPQTTFLPDVKCCSYYPGLPNYLIGGLLASDDSGLQEGQTRIRDIISKRIGVSPVGIQPPALYSLLATRTKDGFGRSHALLCPYYQRETGACTIWPYREAVCSTYYCKTAAAGVGKAFWNALKSYLLFIERQLCVFVLLELGVGRIQPLISDFSYSPKTMPTISAADLNGLPPSDEQYEAMWQAWVGREDELYLQAYQIVHQLSPDDFEKVIGIMHPVLLQELQEKWEKVMRLPPVLMKNPARNLRPVNSESYLIQLDSIHTQFELPQTVVDLFDGRQPYETLQAKLSEEQGVELDRELILTLYHHQILAGKDEDALDKTNKIPVLTAEPNGQTTSL